MLTINVERYLSLRQALGLKLTDLTKILLNYARFASARGDTHITVSSATAWSDLAPSPSARSIRMHQVVRLAQFLHAEDTLHEVPSLVPFHHVYVRPLPYIYAPEEISRIIAATSGLEKCYPLRKVTYATLVGLIAATGLRVSEALNLRFGDVQEDGRVLQIYRTKFGKSRLVPLHPSVTVALGRYLERRRKITTTDDDHVFISAHGRRIASSTVLHTFHLLVKRAKIAPERNRRPRIHDLRHTFATRALEKCAGDRLAIARHFLALSTYLGHIDLKSTYWYQEATPELMTEIAAAGETLAMGGVQ